MGKIKTLIEQHPVLGKRIIDFLVESDPSETNKYLPFLVNHFKSQEKAFVVAPETIKTLSEFERHFTEKRIQETDLTKYKTIADFHTQVKRAKEIEALKKAEKEVIVLEKTPEILAVIPLTKEASSVYGKGTRWCTSGNSYNQFNSYVRSAFLVYIIKTEKTGIKKFALYVTKSAVTCYNDRDDTTSILNLRLSSETLNKVYDFMVEYGSIDAYNLSKRTDVFRINGTVKTINRLNKNDLQTLYHQFYTKNDTEKMKELNDEYNSRNYVRETIKKYIKT